MTPGTSLVVWSNKVGLLLQASSWTKRFIARVANPPGMRVTQLLLEVEAVLAATDARDLAGAARAAAKLGEIDKQLSALSADGRGEKARAYVKDQLKALKLASIEAV
jgi:MoxR-like ATPase